MHATAIPERPIPLSAAQAESMSQRLIKKHHVAIILLHWFNAITWLIELSTGAALIQSAHFRFAPQWYLALMNGFFGDRVNLLRFHIAVGLVWIVVFLVYGIFGRATYLRRQVLEKEVGLDRDDWNWLRVRLLLILGRTREPLPPQGIYNAGQKLFAVAVYTMVPVIMVTGLIMTFHWGPAWVVGWAVAVHFITVAAVVSGLMVHVYMGAVFPEEKPAFFSMLTGMVNELYAYRHHFKWWREVKMAEQEWKSALESGEEQHGLSPAPVAGGGFVRALRSPHDWPPYWAALGLGLTLLGTFLLVGQGLGASGGFTRMVAFGLSLAAPEWAANHAYWGNYVIPGEPVLFDFLVFELAGLLIGALVSGYLGGRLGWRIDRGPRMTRRGRLALAFAGGAIAGAGARMARGCTSGLALSGGAVLSAGAFAFMLAVFAAAFAGAWLLRRIWL